MRLSCKQENLARGLGLVSRAVSSRSTLPVLGNVLLATDQGRLKLSATNLEIVITGWIGAKVEEEGAVTVPARTLNDLVNALPQDRVDMVLDPQTQTLHLSCLRTEANIKGIDANEFPLIPEPEGENRIQLETETFKEMIAQVAFAAATDDTRPTLTGVLTHFEGNKVKMVATDGFRLSIREAEFPGHVEEPISVIVPARALNEVARVVSDSVKAIYVTMPNGRNQIIFDMGDVVVVSQLIDGAFPDFDPVIPKRHTTRTIMSTADFLKACKMADIFAREASHTARVQIQPGDELKPAHATVTATSSETGDNVAQIDADVAGSEVEIAFNVKFMTDVLAVVGAPQIALETTSPTEPGVIKPVGEDGFLHVIMPMHFGR